MTDKALPQQEAAMTVWITESRFKGDADWIPRGDGDRIDAHYTEASALAAIKREIELFGHNTEYRVVAYVRGGETK